MKMKHCSERLCIFALLFLGASLSAQTMPQDNWRYNQHQFSGPDPSQSLRSIAIGSGGVYVGRGSPATAIWQFQENGVYMRQFGTFGAIRGIACDSVGNVYVLDAGDSTIKAFDKDGNALRQWGSAGTNDSEFSFSVDGNTMLTVGTNDEIYVCDPGNSRVQVFDTQGGFLRKWGVAGSLPGQFGTDYPRLIAASQKGMIYVSDPQLAIFDSAGNFIKQIMDLRFDHPIYVTALSADDIFMFNYYAWNCDGNYFRFYDESFAFFRDTVARTLSGFVAGGSAFSKRGDIFSIAGTQVQIIEREYSSVQNPPTPPAVPLPVVFSVSQRTNTAWLDIDFQITDADSSNVAAGVLAFVNGGNTLSAAVPMSTFMEGTGSNIGTNVPTGTKLHLTWNMGADWSIDFAQIQVEVLAKDSRNLMGFHWITVPSDGVNPAFQACRSPVPESELLSVWYWLIASHCPGITFAGCTVTGVGGDYDGLLLANDSGTTAAGRAFAYSQMHVRAITQAEINRINAGNYGFISVDANTVVKLP
jgi:hypothetical protein